MSLCDSVCNKWSNISATFHPVGRNFFVSNWARMYVSKKISQPWAGGPGQNMRDLSSFLSYLTRYRSKILKLWSKIKKWKWKYFFLNGRWPWPMRQTDYAYFGPYQLFALQWPTIILHFKFKMIKKYLISSYLASRQPCVRLKRPATWGPNYMRWQFFS